MPDERLFNEALDREADILEIHLEGKAMRTSVTLEEYIQSRLAAGTAKDLIKKELLQDLESKGRIFGEFFNGMKATAKGNINRMRDMSEASELGIEDIKYRWVAVLINTCPDCLSRHNQVATWDEWEALGLPRTGATVCREHCKCMLLPADTTETQPIQRGK